MSLIAMKSEDALAKYLPVMPLKMQEKFEYHDLPNNFKRFGLHSSFLVSFWKSLLAILIILGIALISAILDGCISCRGIIKTMISNIKEAVKWNFFLTFLMTFYDTIVLYTSFDLRTIELNSVFPVISLIVCICVNILAVYIIVKELLVVKLLQTRKSVIKRAMAKYRNYEVVFKIFKNKSFLSQAFIPIFTIRIYLFTLIIAYLFEHPLVQAILITLLTAAMCLYLLIVQPFKEKIRLIQYLFQEGIILIVNSCVLTFAVMDYEGSDAIETREGIENVILISNIVFTIGGSGLLVLQILLKAYQLLKQYRLSQKLHVPSIKRSQRLEDRSRRMTELQELQPARLHSQHFVEIQSERVQSVFARSRGIASPRRSRR